LTRPVASITQMVSSCHLRWVMAPAARLLVDTLRQENRDLHDQIAALEKRLAELEAENRQLREQLEQAQREAARQAAPFRRPEHKKVPDDQKKRPGRKPGHPGSHRAVPAVVDEHVEVPLPGCPCCGAPVSAVEAIEQFVEEIPPVRPHVTRIVTYKGTCPNCGEVRSRHPLQMSQATGAAKTQVGPRALALAATLNKQLGLTTRTTCRVLEIFSGLRLTPGGLVQALERAADKMQPAYEQLIKDLRGAAAVFTDETSWYVGEPGSWLWTFTTADTTVYEVDPSRGHEVPLEMLGPEFAGMLVSDCLATYDPLPYRQHKCIAHHQKAIAKALSRPDTIDASYLRQWQLLMTMVIVLWRHRQRSGEDEFIRQRTHLESWCDRLLAEPRTQPGDVAVGNRLRKRRASLFGCLYEPAAEPTNNRAERSFRWAVITRKVSCGNKTESGAKCFEVLASLARTCLDRGRDFVSYLVGCLPMNAAAQAIPPPDPPG
jgi:transposase